MALDSSDNWMVAGGGQRFLTLWHLPSLTPMAYMPTQSIPQAVCFTQDDTVHTLHQAILLFIDNIWWQRRLCVPLEKEWKAHHASTNKFQVNIFYIRKHSQRQTGKGFFHLYICTLGLYLRFFQEPTTVLR
jgi:hypothetical protein